MAKLHHKMAEDTETCGVSGCSKPAERSISVKKVEGNVEAGFKENRERGQVRLCKEHYKEYKRKTRDKRLTDTLGWER